MSADSKYQLARIGEGAHVHVIKDGSKKTFCNGSRAATPLPDNYRPKPDEMCQTCEPLYKQHIEPRQKAQDKQDPILDVAKKITSTATSVINGLFQRKTAKTKSAPTEVNVEHTELRKLAIATDTKLSELYKAAWKSRDEIVSIADNVRSRAGGKRNYKGHGQYEWDISLQDAIDRIAAKQLKSWDQGYAEKYVSELRTAQAALKEIEAETAVYDAIYQQHKWHRAFIVVNHDGHVHATMQCSTCFPSTRFQWLPTYSGASEDEIVGDAGRSACTVCYPSAPADVLNREPKIVSEEQASKEAARIERAAAKAVRDAKTREKAATEDGSELVVPGGRWKERFKTEVTAVSWYTDHKTRWFKKDSNEYDEAFRIIEQALAKKHGVSVEAMQAQLAAKVEAKRKRLGK